MSLSEIYSLPKKMFNAALKRQSALFWLALDAFIPPTILWLLLLSGGAVLSLFLLFYGMLLPSTILLSCLILLVSAISVSWLINARDIVRIKDILGVIGFLFSKLAIYSTFFTSRQKHWVRTTRDDKHE